MQIVFFNEGKKNDVINYFYYPETIQIKFGYGEVGSFRLTEFNSVNFFVNLILNQI